MSKNKLAIPRLTHFVAMLKANRYPNHPMLVKEMQMLDIAGAYSITQKTLQRDVAFLRGDYDAPIEYDHHRHGYYLKDLSWTWDVPQLNDSDLNAAVVSTHFAEALVPPPQNKQVRKTMDSLLISSESTVKKIENLLSLTAFGAGIPINPEIFSTVFSCWQKRHILFISYSRAKDGKTADLIVEPQVLSFFEGCWYLKVKVRKTSNPTFAPVPVIALALHRIKQAKELLEQFCDDSKIIKTAADGDIFEFPKIKKLTVKVHGKGYRFAIERFQHDILKNFDNDSALLAIYDIEEYRAFNLVFTWPEDIEVVLPRSFRKKIYMAAQFVMEQHMSVTPQTVTKKQRI